MNYIKINFAGLSPAEKIHKAGSIVDLMDGNPLFPNPTPTLAEVRTLIDELESASQDALYGGTDRISLANVCAKKLNVAITGLGGYVLGVSKGDPQVILASGFELRSIPSASKPVGDPDAPVVKPGRLEGEVKLSWNPVAGARSYSVRMSKDNGATWEDCGKFTRSRIVIPGLESGTRPWFQVSAFGTLGESNWSEAGMGKVA